MRNPATVSDVAKSSGVSTATVSRALNGDPKVSEKTAEQVRRAAAALGYSVNRAARSLKTRETRTIGVIAPDLSSWFFMLVAECLERELAARGYGLLVCSSRGDAAEEKRRLGLFAERVVDGIVAMPATSSGIHFRDAVAAGTPLVLMDRAPRGSDADAVLVDNEGGAYGAVMALGAEGHKRIGFIGGDPSIITARERRSGYRRAMRDLGLAVESEFELSGRMDMDSGFRLMDAMLAWPDAPDAYFIVNADTHIGATKRLMAAPRAVKDRIVFAAFDLMPYSPLLRFCKFAVAQPVEEMGREAARAILERVAGGHTARPRIIRLQTTLIRN